MTFQWPHRPMQILVFIILLKFLLIQSQGGVGVTYTPWLKDLGLNDVYLASLAGYYKFDENQAINASVRYFSLGNIQFTDNLVTILIHFVRRNSELTWLFAQIVG